MSPGAALPALCLLVRGCFVSVVQRNWPFGVRDGMPDRAGHDDEGFAVHGIGVLVYGMGCPIRPGMTMRGCRTRNWPFGVRDGYFDNGCLQ